VTGKINRNTCKYEIAKETKLEQLKTKIRHAARSRGSQLLLIRQKAEKLQKPRLIDFTPVSFDIEVEK